MPADPTAAATTAEREAIAWAIVRPDGSVDAVAVKLSYAQRHVELWGGTIVPLYSDAGLLSRDETIATLTAETARLRNERDGWRQAAESTLAAVEVANSRLGALIPPSATGTPETTDGK